MTWTTRLEPALTAQYQAGELHSAWFTPKGWPGKGETVSLLIPECELQLTKIGDDGKPLTFINRPEVNRNVKRWLRTACEMAERDRRGAFPSLRYERTGGARRQAGQ
jgi:hypothetical protein